MLLSATSHAAHTGAQHGASPGGGASAQASLRDILSRFDASRAPRHAGLVRAEDARARYGFRVATLGLMVAPLTRLEIVNGKAVAPLPRAPAWLDGMMNLRGNPVPVFDLRRALELPAACDAEAPNVLVIEQGSHAAGIVVDGLPQPLRGLSRIAAPGAIPGRLEPFVLAVWLDGDSLWIEIDHRAFFLSLTGRRAAEPAE